MLPVADETNRFYALKPGEGGKCRQGDLAQSIGPGTVEKIAHRYIEMDLFFVVLMIMVVLVAVIMIMTVLVIVRVFVIMVMVVRILLLTWQSNLGRGERTLCPLRQGEDFVTCFQIALRLIDMGTLFICCGQALKTDKAAHVCAQFHGQLCLCKIDEQVALAMDMWLMRRNAG